MPDPVVDETLRQNIVPPFRGGTLTMVHGKTRRFRFQVVDRSTRLPVDITLWTSFRFMGKNQFTDADGAAVISKSLGSGITAITPSAGVIEVLLQPADTSGLSDLGVQLFAEAQGVDPTGLPWTLWQGALDIQSAVIVAQN